MSGREELPGWGKALVILALLAIIAAGTWIHHWYWSSIIHG